MRICINFCKNCGAEYRWQASGSYEALDIPKEYQDSEYCPECKKAIVDALSKIEKKSEIKWIKTDEITIQRLLEIEEENRLKDIEKNSLFPICMKVYPTLYNTETGETSKSGEVKYNEKIYGYFYFPCKINEASITKKARIDIKTKHVITDIFYK